ncbi:MAG: polysaccharide deacetylase family protein [Candidatus Scalindua sp.]|jgi:peptidoglycan/xylan/chitin deacetylase (PgdA/CDA1 family)|nr:polysaccharide deacetylase family protein [Candidatus Scalindua sp.]MBT6045480.1 polysaccharide deacetylase family protein [Candidatus Scalindua sp.]
MVDKVFKDSDCIILLYHGVTIKNADDIENYSGKHLYYNNFEKHMRYLREYTNPTSLSDIVQSIKQGETIPPRSVAITFDDGFQNNFSVAFPILKKYEIPATFYLSTGFIGTNRLFWVDEVEGLIRLTRKRSVNIRVKSKEKEFLLDDKEKKINVIREIKEEMKSIQDEGKDILLEDLRNQLDVSLENIRESAMNYKTMSWDEVRKMNKEPFIEFGCHTVNHIILSQVSVDVCKREIVESKKKLEQELDQEIDLFAYPEGRRDDFNTSIIRTLKKEGFQSSPSAIWGGNRIPSVDPFYLHRIMVGFEGTSFPQYENVQCVPQ